MPGPTVCIELDLQQSSSLRPHPVGVGYLRGFDDQAEWSGGLLAPSNLLAQTSCDQKADAVVLVAVSFLPVVGVVVNQSNREAVAWYFAQGLKPRWLAGVSVGRRQGSLFLIVCGQIPMFD